MLDGEVVEEAHTEQLFSRPAHPYTVELLSSVPDVYGSVSPPATERLVER